MRARSHPATTPSLTFRITWWSNTCITSGRSSTHPIPAISGRLTSKKSRNAFPSWKRKWRRTRRKSTSGTTENHISVGARNVAECGSFPICGARTCVWMNILILKLLFQYLSSCPTQTLPFFVFKNRKEIFNFLAASYFLYFCDIYFVFNLTIDRIIIIYRTIMKDPQRNPIGNKFEMWFEMWLKGFSCLTSTSTSLSVYINDKTA